MILMIFVIFMIPVMQMTNKIQSISDKPNYHTQSYNSHKSWSIILNHTYQFNHSQSYKSHKS